jgi:hypothetical protein
MKRKLLSVLSLVFVLLMAGGTVYATGTSESSGYDPVTYDDTIGFNAVLQDDGSIRTNWSKYSHEEPFTFYKVVRSKDNANPVYPDDGYIYYESDVNVLSYTDMSVPAGTSYYRVCQIASPKRYCSKTVMKVYSDGVTGSVDESVEGTGDVPDTTANDDQSAVPTVNSIDGFEDMPADNFAADCVKELASDGIVLSGEGVYFRPESPVNRAEFLKMVMKAYYTGSAVYDGSSCFRDVGGSAWYAPYICEAKTNGIVAGYSDNSYQPVRNITRAEGAAILVKALRVPLTDWEGVPFKDVYTAWQKDAVATAYTKGLVRGYNLTDFGPNDLLTRAQAAKLICNARTNFTAPLDGEVPVIGAEENTIDTTETAGNPVPAVGTASRTYPLIVNHANTGISAVPDEYVTTAKTMFKIAYGHTSHGSQIVTGMGVLEGQDSLFSYRADGSGESLYLNEGLLSGDLGGDWETQTRNLLNDNTNGINMVMWSWCGQLSAMSSTEVNGYLNGMDALEKDFPGVTFVYMTGHLDGSGESGQLNLNNEAIRAFAKKYNKVLFDFADIESYNPTGSYFLDLNANDNNDYDGGNWAQNWCAANADSPLCATNSCAHSQPLNCNLKARAFWWMMARLAGWGS